MAVNPVSKDSTKINWIPYVVAFVILVVFGVFVYYMLGLTKVAETEWTRAVYLFNGVEAVAFAAAGFLFGKEVHRAQAENADRRANQAEKNAADAEKDAAGGKILATVIKEKTKALHGRAKTFASTGKGIVSSAGQGDLEELKAIADELFP
jgi:hypothetical protein